MTQLHFQLHLIVDSLLILAFMIVIIFWENQNG